MHPSNPFSLEGRCVFITGGTRGVGAAIARSVAQAGGDLLLHGLHDDDDARQTLAECRAYGVRVDLITGDLIAEVPDTSNQSRCESLIQKAIERCPDINALVNNAGTYNEGSFLDVDEATYYRTMQLNVSAGLFITRALASHWVKQRCAGRILFTGSINGLLAEPTHVCYDTSKGAVAAMVRSLCVELAPHGMRVNSIAPGLVRTPMTNIIETDAEFRQWMELHTPNGKVPHADVCGPPAVFLLSDAAEHIQGQTLYVDGGMSAWQQPDRPSN